MLRGLDVFEIEFRDAVLAHASEEAGECCSLEVLVAGLWLPILILDGQTDASRDVLTIVR